MVNYPFIIAHGRLLGSNPPYVARQLLLAEEAGAPWNAVRRDQGGNWRTTAEYTSDSALARLVKNLPSEFEMECFVDLANRTML